MSSLSIEFKNGKLVVNENGKETIFHSVENFKIEMQCDSECLIDTQCEYDFDTDMPEKGYGYFVIDKAENKEKVRIIIKEHVGEFEIEYMPENFIQSDDERAYDQYYGKFNINDLEGLYDKIHQAGISIVAAKFFTNYDL